MAGRVLEELLQEQAPDLRGRGGDDDTTIDPCGGGSVN